MVRPASPTTTMTEYYHLSTRNAGRQCGACGDRRATAYVHGAGFRCAECADVPDELREYSADGNAEDGIDPRRNGAG